MEVGGRDAQVLGGGDGLAPTHPLGDARDPDRAQSPAGATDDSSDLRAVEAGDVDDDHHRREHADVHEHKNVKVEDQTQGEPKFAPQEQGTKSLLIEGEAVAPECELEGAIAQAPPRPADEGDEREPTPRGQPLYGCDRRVPVLGVVDGQADQDDGQGEEGHACPARAQGPAPPAPRRVEALAANPAKDQAQDHEREPDLPQVHGPGHHPEQVGSEDVAEVGRGYTREVIEVEGVIEGVALPPYVPGLGAAGPQVDGGQLEDHESPGPSRDPAIDGLEQRWVSRCPRDQGARALARSIAVVELSCSAEATEAEPVVDAVGVAALGQHQVHEHDPEDPVGARLVDGVSAHEAEGQEQADEAGEPGLEAEQKREGEQLEGREVPPKEGRAVPEK